MVSGGPLMTTAQVGEYLQVPEKTLKQWRWSGDGPPFIKVGHAVRYRPTDVEAWLRERRRAAA